MGLRLDDLANTYACFNKQQNIRSKSSSGGIFTVLASYVIKNDGIVYGVTYDENYMPIHRSAENLAEITQFLGSKYVQSNLGSCFQEAKEHLMQGRLVMFTGTPCQIRGLKGFLKKDYDNLITMDNICHGVPSPNVWRQHLNEHGDYKRIRSVEFRNKETGWKNYSIQIDYGDNIYKRTYMEDYYMCSFLHNFSLRPSCYQCTVKEENVVSDFTVGDFWGADKIEKDMDDDKGISLVFLNTDKAQKIWNIISDELVIKNVSGSEAAKYNPCLKQCVSMPENRALFFEMLRKGKTVKASYIRCQEGTIVRRVLRKIKRTLVR